MMPQKNCMASLLNESVSSDVIPLFIIQPGNGNDKEFSNAGLDERDFASFDDLSVSGLLSPDNDMDGVSEEKNGS